MKVKSTKLIGLLALVMILPLISSCFQILSVKQSIVVQPGAPFSALLKIQTQDKDATPHHGIVGLLIPNDWQVNTVRFDGDFGPGACSFLHPDSADAEQGGQVDFWTKELETRYPSGDALQWVVYQSDQAYASNVDLGNVDLHVDLQAGKTEGAYNIGYFVSNAALDFTDAKYYSIKLDNPVKVTKKQPHLLISEIVVTPTAGEYFEIYNGTGETIDLTHYYVTDAIYKNNNSYINIVDNTYPPFASDFLAKFPDGATIADGEYQVVATSGTPFKTTYGIDANYELLATSADVPDMVAPAKDYIGGTSGLTNNGEVLILYYWDGVSDLVQDVDYVVWGDKEEAVDKTNVQKDGPDADTTPSTYVNDTPVATQISASAADPHAVGQSIARANMIENGELAFMGNGIVLHDETSENLAKSFIVATPTPKAPGPVTKNTVTFQCNMDIQIQSGTFKPATDKLVVRGNFNGWAGTQHELTDTDGDKIYTLKVDLDDALVGTVVEYKHV
ncbi:lamin tail domain-containing protein, partial [candidate division KSB1 bacterium]|nr:lamin tail domain-containing protein [candidate division KSB1 bacterium]